MENQHILLHVAVILIFCKLIASLSLRAKLPSVIGYILFGIVVGPMGFRLLEAGGVITWLSRVGAIMLLLEAGLETDVPQMKRQGLVAFAAAGGGVLLPLGLGFGFCLMSGESLVASSVMGNVLTATSVGVTTMTLVDMGKLRTLEGTTILSAAIIDDVLGIIFLTVTIGLVVSSGSLFLGLLGIAAYVVVAFLVGQLLFPSLVKLTGKLNVEHAMVSIGLASAFVFAWAAELVGVAEITGAYLAGLFFGRTAAKREVMEGIWSMGQAVFVSIFFVEIGLRTSLRVSEIHWGFLGGILLVAVVGKVIGCGLAARIGGMSNRAALRVGIGMVPRGEVGLIIASIGLTRGLIGQLEFSTAVIMVIVTATLAPIGLKWAFASPESPE
jgi:Kef-type K+ transport system membrane component KefB